MPLIQEAKLLSRFIGQRARGWGFTAIGWGGAAGVVALYMTDWKVIMGYVPFVNKKYDHEIPS